MGSETVAIRRWLRGRASALPVLVAASAAAITLSTPTAVSALLAHPATEAACATGHASVITSRTAMDIGRYSLLQRPLSRCGELR